MFSAPASGYSMRICLQRIDRTGPWIWDHTDIPWDPNRRNLKIGTLVLAHKIACVTNRTREPGFFQVSRASAQVTNQLLPVGSLLKAKMLLWLLKPWLLNQTERAYSVSPDYIRQSLWTCLRKTWQRQKAYAELEGEAGVEGIFQISLPGVALLREALVTRIVTEVGDCIWHILCLAHSIYVCHNSYLCSLIRSERHRPFFPPPLEN